MHLCDGRKETILRARDSYEGESRIRVCLLPFLDLGHALMANQHGDVPDGGQRLDHAPAGTSFGSTCRTTFERNSEQPTRCFAFRARRIYR